MTKKLTRAAMGSRRALQKHRNSKLISSGSTETHMGRSVYYAEVCFVVASMFPDSGRASTIRRNFYRVIDRYAWRTPLGWLMDRETCTEVEQKLEQLDKEYRELVGRPFISTYRAILGVQELKKMLEKSAPPERGDVAMRLRRILETREEVAVKP
jgi:hypothetical protein